MEKLVSQYCRDIKKRFKAGISTEHSYRADLQNLLETLVSGITVTNEPKRQKCGAPDFIVQRKDLPVGYIEAKDVGGDLDKIERSEQLKRYRESLSNLILTDYSEFRFIREGATEKKIKIAEAHDNFFKPLPENFGPFVSRIKDFCSYKSYTIKSAEGLAKTMAKKARMMEEVIYQALIAEDEDSSLRAQYKAFKKILIHDLTEQHFADIYAQTIAYGLFAARLHDPTLEDFSREEAMFLVPRSNPFLRKLFSYITGPELDDRIVWIVDDLADIFRNTDVHALLADFGKTTQLTDPFIYFYETFLAEYDANLRRKRGVYYTPEPVVNFIVRAVDDILQSEFGLSQGLADTSKVEYKVDIPGDSKKAKKQFHKVQILDPAAGTGTFLAEVVKLIHGKFENQKGIWPSYAEKELIPRLNGFEVMMASYTICHLKLEMLLRETGYRPRKDAKQQRLQVFLTNSLEEPDSDITSIFAHWLSSEAKEAGLVKRDAPVMVVLGNPPYSVSSSNKGEWIKGLIKAYKKNLDERNINPLSDDYIKFIRYGEHFIEKNGEGVLAFISNNSFIDGLIHREMRKHLMQTFDLIYILDLHGNYSKKETAPDGNKDENVFDNIQQGVSVNILVKKVKKNRNKKAKIFHFDVFGKRKEKYQFLSQKTLQDIQWNNIVGSSPYYFFVPKDFERAKAYNKGFKINELFNLKNSGIKTHRDKLVIDYDRDSLKEKIQQFLSPALSEEEVIKRFAVKNSSTWQITNARKHELDANNIVPILYRPFDIRYIYYFNGLIDRAREDTMSNLINKDNIAFIAMRQAVSAGIYLHFGLSESVVDNRVFYSNKGIPVILPLYIYQKGEATVFSQEEIRTPNLNSEIVTRIAQNLNLEFVPEKEDREGIFAPIDLLDYIYAALFSPSYREAFKDFLKIDFPRVPYPKNAATFWQLAEYGGRLRQIHLLESPDLNNSPVAYPEEGDSVVTRRIVKGDFEITDADNQVGQVWINDRQYFARVPAVAWEFYIGGYQPAQKWLKDRRGRELSYQDIEHYRKMIAALIETDRLMKEIDGIEFL